MPLVFNRRIGDKALPRLLRNFDVFDLALNRAQ